ncbi:MAG TPA: hypothetical protein VK427_14120, partial [Kofleriaceae bacterium]|nr:hypothetical protein [Kofleriaceae bacterium]
TVKLHNECHYCIAMHSAQLAATHADVVAALRAGSALADERLEALRLFTRAMLETRARPDDATHARFTAAGFTDENALDVTLGVGVYTSSTFLNVLTGAELDPAFAAHAWHAPA